MPTRLGLRPIEGTNIAYAVMRDGDFEPEVVELDQPYVSRYDRLIMAAQQSGWVHLVHSARGVDTTDQSIVSVEFFRLGVEE